MNSLIWWVGLATIAAAGIVLLYLLWLLVLAAAAAVSVLRWRIAVCRAHAIKIHWLRAPEMLFSTWLDFIPYSKGRVTMSGDGGRWNGIGDWVVHPKRPSKV